MATADCAAGSRPAKAPATPPPGRIPSPLPGSAGIEAGVVRISVAAEPRPNETAAIAVAVLRVRAGAGEDAVRAALAEVGATLVVPFVDAVAGSDGPAASSGTPALYPNQMRPVPAPELGRSTAAHVSTRNGVAYAELVVIDGRTIYALLGAAPGAKPATPLGDLGMVARRLLSRADSGTPPATPEAGGTAGLWEALPRPEDLPPGFVVDREWVLVGDAAGTPIPNAADE